MTRADPGPAGEPLANAVGNLLRRQDASGRWEGEVVWNTMLLSQYVLTGRWPLADSDRSSILRHYQATLPPIRLDRADRPSCQR